MTPQQKTSRNFALKQQLAILEARAIYAKTREDIQKIVSYIKDYSQSHQYKHNNSLLWLSLVFAALVGALSYWQPMDISSDTRFYMLVASGISALLTLILFYMRYAEVKRVGDSVYIRSVAINAGVVRDYRFDGKAYWKQLRGMFSLFNCGDEGQTITTRYLGGVQDKENEYVTTTSRTKHFKYGMLVQFSDFNYLSLNVRRFATKWDSASRLFNRKFTVYCRSELQAAKFFDPKAVLKFADEFAFLKSMDISSDSVACFELSKDVFPTKVRSPSLRNPEQFISALESPDKLPALEQAQKLIAFINENK
jgi:hypothetical protein